VGTVAVKKKKVEKYICPHHARRNAIRKKVLRISCRGVEIGCSIYIIYPIFIPFSLLPPHNGIHTHPKPARPPATITTAHLPPISTHTPGTGTACSNCHAVHVQTTPISTRGPGCITMGNAGVLSIKSSPEGQKVPNKTRSTPPPSLLFMHCSTSMLSWAPTVIVCVFKTKSSPTVGS
jgi:hypothetical protein